MSTQLGSFLLLVLFIPSPDLLVFKFQEFHGTYVCTYIADCKYLVLHACMHELSPYDAVLFVQDVASR